MTIFHVTVAPDYRWSTARVGGRDFSKTTVAEIQERDLTDEIRDSPILQVTEVKPPRQQRRKGGGDDTDG